MHRVESSDFKLTAFCRGYDYYVDPLSNETLELGTREYPYRSLKSVNYEILSIFSHSENSITIHTKDAYLEEETAKYFNMTSVKITSHPEVLAYDTRSILIPTYESQPGIMEKALFNLIASADEMTFVQDYLSLMVKILNLNIILHLKIYKVIHFLIKSRFFGIIVTMHCLNSILVMIKIMNTFFSNIKLAFLIHLFIRINNQKPLVNFQNMN